MKIPYVGITGFMSSEEVDSALIQFRRGSPLIKNASERVLYQGENDRIFMVGVLASLKTFFSKTNKRSRYPRIEEIKEIFGCSRNNALNIVHYSTDEHEKTLYSQIVALTEIIGSSTGGIQLNVPWPNEYHLEAYKKFYPHKIIILQVGREALDMAKILKLKVCLESYKGLIDYILFDPSEGNGEAFNVVEMLQCLRTAKDVFGESVGLGVAGGLSAETLDILKPIVKEFSNISIDAEGRLRNSNDSLDLNEAEKYIKKSFEVLKER